MDAGTPPLAANGDGDGAASRQVPPSADAGWRLFHADRPADFAIRQPDPSIAWGFVWDRASLSRSWPAAFAVESAFDVPTDRLVSADVARATQIARQGQGGARVRLWSLDAVRTVVAYGEAPGPGLVETARQSTACRPPLVRFENPAAFPRARLARRAPVLAASSEEALRLSLEPSFDPAREFIADAGEGQPPEPDIMNAADREPAPADGASTLESWQRIAPGSLAIRASAGEGDWLVLAENWDSAWQARVDGRLVPARRAYGFLIAVPLSAGRHAIRLDYAPRRLPGSLLLLLAAGLPALGALALARIR